MGICVFGGVNGAPVDLPLSCFVVHCESTRANEGMFLDLSDLVAFADTFGIPLTIDCTAQWAEMILADARKLDAASAWLVAGREIAGHHHAYWATLDRGAQWDGYTNTSFSELLPILQDRYLGMMDEYMALLEALPGERTTACMGLGDGRDLIDWPEALLYGTAGHLLVDCVSEPTLVDHAGFQTWQITDGLILQEPSVLPAFYEATNGDKVFAVVGHAYNFAEDRRPFESWVRFLRERDSDGVRRRTVTKLIEERLNDGS